MPGLSNSVDRFNGVLASLAVKVPCVAAAEVPITLSGNQTVNGVAVVTGDRVLVTAQASSVENGIYDVSDSTWARSADFDGNRDVTTDTFLMAARDTGSPVFWRCTSALPIVINSSSIVFELFFDPDVSGLGNLQAVTDVGAITDNNITIEEGAQLYIQSVAGAESTGLYWAGPTFFITPDNIGYNLGLAVFDYVFMQETRQTGAAYIFEQSAADADLSQYGQVWVNDVPNPHELMFTNDNGDDINLTTELWDNGTRQVLSNSLGVGIRTALFIGNDDNGFGSGAGILYMAQRSAAAADRTDIGQFWVRDDASQTPMFTDDLGVDTELGSAPLTPWTEDIDAAGFALSDVGDLEVVASADAAIGITFKRFSATGRAQMTLERQDDTEVWRFGMTGAGVENFSFFNSLEGETPINLLTGGGMDLVGAITFYGDSDTDATLTGVNTTATHAFGGAGFRLTANDGAAMATGHRLGSLLFGGAEDASDTFHYPSLIQATALENWSASVNGSDISFAVTPIGSTTRATALTVTSDQVTIEPAKILMATGGPTWEVGTGDPEGAVTAEPGSLFLRTDGAAGTTFYIKETGSGNTGWGVPGGAPGGSTTEIQFNNAGAFDGDSGLFWTAASNRLEITDDATGTLRLSVASDVAIIESNNLNRFEFTPGILRLTDAGAHIQFPDTAADPGAVSGHGSIFGDGNLWSDTYPAWINAAGDKLQLANFDSHQYYFQTSTAASDPAVGGFKFDNATPASVTAIYIDDLSQANLNQHKMLSQISSGDLIRITNGGDDNEWFMFLVDGAPTDNTGWWTIDVTYISSNTLFSAGDACQIDVQYLSHGPAGGGSQTPWAADIDAAGFTLDDSTNVLTIGAVGTLMHLISTSDVSPSSTDHPFQIGLTSGENIRMDGNEIMGVDNGSSTALSLQAEDGDVRVGASSTVAGAVRLMNETQLIFDAAAAGTDTVLFDWDTSADEFTISPDRSDVEFLIVGWEKVEVQSNALRMSGTYPHFIIEETDATANEGIWTLSANSDILRHGLALDSTPLLSSLDYMLVRRTGIVCDSVEFRTTVSVDSTAGTEGMDMSCDGTDFDMVGDTITDFNLSGVTAFRIAAKTVVTSTVTRGLEVHGPSFQILAFDSDSGNDVLDSMGMNLADEIAWLSATDDSTATVRGIINMDLQVGTVRIGNTDGEIFANNDLHLEDNTELRFGDAAAGDATILYDATDTLAINLITDDLLEIQEGGTAKFRFNHLNNRFSVLDGNAVLIYSSGDGEWLDLSHDGADAHLDTGGSVPGSLLCDVAMAWESSTEVISTNAATITVEEGNGFEIDLDAATGNVTITLSGGPPTGKYYAMSVRVIQDDVDRTITWAGGAFIWADGAQHVQATGNDAVSIYTFETWDGGTTWNGSGRDYS